MNEASSLSWLGRRGAWERCAGAARPQAPGHWPGRGSRATAHTRLFGSPQAAGADDTQVFSLSALYGTRHSALGDFRKPHARARGARPDVWDIAPRRFDSR